MMDAEMERKRHVVRVGCATREMRDRRSTAHPPPPSRPVEESMNELRPIYRYIGRVRYGNKIVISRTRTNPAVRI